MNADHLERMDELARERDALGLVKEARRYQQERAEEERAAHLETARRRQDVAERLAELAEEYAQERAQRQQQHMEDLAENEKQRQEELKANALAQAEELKQIREQKAQRLKELQEGLDAERIRRREMMIAQIRDLDASLLGERTKKVQYYNLMLQDAEAFLRAYRLKMSLAGATGTGAPVRDTGGYVNKGLYRMAWDGAKEFVMSNQTTRAAERLIGANLTQQNLMRALSDGGANGGSQYVYQDHRRLDQHLSPDQQEMYKRGAMEALKELTGVAYGR